MLIGRETECAAIDDLVAGPRGRALALLGEPGVGKTALLEAAARRPDAGVVLRAGGVESEAQLPFAGLLDLLRPVLHLRDALPAPQQAALASALALGPPAPGDRFTVCVAVAELLARAGARERHLVVVDDLPWLDPPSREAVLYLARRVPAGVAMLITARAEAAATLPPGLEALVVAPLPDDAALALLREHAPDLPADVARRLVAAAAGLPLALLELPSALTAAQRTGADPVEDPLPAGPVLCTAFGGRVATLSPCARTAVLVLAAHGDRDLAPVVRTLEALGGDAAALAEAEAARCVVLRPGSAEFVHPVVRSVVYTHAEPAERRRIHGVLADVLGDDRAAWHRAAAATHPSEEVASALDTVATRAAARRAHATAAAALERAAALSEDRATRARRLLGSARAAARAGLLEPARRVLEALDTLQPEPALRLRGAQLRGFLEAWDSDAGDAGELLARTAAEIGEADPDAGAAMLADASLVATVAGDCRGALDRAEAAAQLDRSERDLRVGAALSWALTLRGQGERARALVERLAPALPALDPLSPDAQFLTIALNVRAPTEGYAAALADARRVAAAAREAGALAALPIALSVAADAA